MLIRVSDHPQLAALLWNRPGTEALDGAEALAIYERNWRHIDEAALSPAERRLIEALVAAHGGGVLLV